MLVYYYTFKYNNQKVLAESNFSTFTKQFLDLFGLPPYYGVKIKVYKT